MGRGKDLTEEEKAVISALVADKMSVRNIATRIERSKSAVHQYIVASKQGNNANRPGRKSSISKVQHRAIVRAASTGKQTAREIRDTYGCKVTVRRVQQLLRCAPNLNYRKMVCGPSLSSKHKEARVKWAKDYVHWRTRWRRVIFSDEKKFNLDGPDGLSYYWHDLRKEPRYFSKRQQGGGGVTIWAAMSYNSVSNVAVLQGYMNSDYYCQVLTHCLFPFASEECPGKWIFQQDNASCHRSKYTKSFLFDNEVDVLPWPARSPDLNIIENLWGIIVRDIYKDSKHYGSKDELKVAIMEAWNNIPVSTLHSLYESMHNRCVSLIEREGRKLKY